MKVTPIVLLHQSSFEECSRYQARLVEGAVRPGVFLSQALAEESIDSLSAVEFLLVLINTKKPQIFAESSVWGDGSDWNQDELAILGNISVAVPVTVYDNGLHRFPTVYKRPISATLVYVPGALLRNDTGNQPADWDAVVRECQIDPGSFLSLLEKRLLAPLLFINQKLGEKGGQGLVTVPGIGCGQFSGEFHGQIGEFLRRSLVEILTRHIDRIPRIKAVYFDPYSECDNERQQIGHLSFICRPLLKGNETKSQLCEPATFQEKGDDFSGCDLFSMVAWDHVSWPGNDFYIGSRATDDGVKAAATSSMHTVTGVRGHYNPLTYTYDPPNDYRNWAEVVQVNKLRLGELGQVIVRA